MSSRNIMISPSIIAGDLSTMGENVKGFDPAVVDLLHMDVMDGHFVPNLTFGPGFIADLGRHTEIPLDVHLMIEKPELSLDSYINLNPWCIVIHYESTRFPARCLSLIREKGIKGGISINPATPVESVFDILPYCDMALVMSVDPGFYGQSFMETAIPRIEKLKKFIDSNHEGKILIQVDGGINAANISRVVSAGADIIVAGSSSFKGGDVNGNTAALKKAALGN
ncbi:MAG TPA: ribulose-phosphate 3-epimerase [Spirochaetota bacterium]|nr:ribulose-phosphate 3-epimerase [Spirochaetota bacterium]